MHDGFMKGLIWGSIAGAVLYAVIGPMTTSQRKPLTERSVDAIADTTQDLMRTARHARRRLMRKLD
ncbi:hypothetical protein SDC9_30287 [bioreactor metagenome]|uniref:YtxH domain-containing protein n=1 Tax=bioreactor metagenome TaxID=1076179 RepID=A0A644V090_9ZZZZ|nr:hypothetical protein [Negativicutes bacterium]